MFKRQIGAILLGTTVAWGSFTVGVVPSAQAVPLDFFPPDIQQVLQFKWARVPAEAKQQDLAAIQALSPAQAQQYITNARVNLRTIPKNKLVQMGSVVEQIRTSLPPMQRQTFVNGLWGVSPAEEAFVHQVYQRIAQANASNQATSQEIQRHLNNMKQMSDARNQALLEETFQQGQKWSDVFGGQSRIQEPQTGYERIVPWENIPTGIHQWWDCPWSYQPIPSDTWPGSGCREVPAPR